MKKRPLFGTLCLLLTSVIWGFAFVAQREGMDAIGPLVFNSMRSFLGMACLLPVIAVLDCTSGGKVTLWGQAGVSVIGRRILVIAGLCCGVCLSIASALQQIGIKYCPVGKSGFLTALYIVIVPILGIFLKRRTTWLVWVSALLALAGSYLLCGFSGEPAGIGDVCLLSCALFFSFHILVIDHFAPLTDCVRMSCIQFGVTGVISFIAGCLFREPISWEIIRAALIPILFCGICSSGIAYTLQIVGQKHVHPVVATLLMSLESVFSAIGGWLFRHECLTGMALAGCIVIFIAVILTQLPIGIPHPQPTETKEQP